MAKAMHPDTLLAYEMNGEPLPLMHGRPLRLLVSGWYGMNSVKWLVGLHVLDHEFKGFYMTERYMTQNEPGSPIPYNYYTKLKVKSIITNPVPGEIIPVTGYQLAGAAWSGEQEITKVEFSEDGGESWVPVDVLHPRVGYSWNRWSTTGSRPLRAITPSCAGPPTAWGTPSPLSSPTSGTVAATAITWSSPSRWRCEADPYTEHAGAVRLRAGRHDDGGSDYLLRGLGRGG